MHEKNPTPSPRERLRVKKTSHDAHGSKPEGTRAAPFRSMYIPIERRETRETRERS